MIIDGWLLMVVSLFDAESAFSADRLTLFLPTTIGWSLVFSRTATLLGTTDELELALRLELIFNNINSNMKTDNWVKSMLSDNNFVHKMINLMNIVRNSEYAEMKTSKCFSNLKKKIIQRKLTESYHNRISSSNDMLGHAYSIYSGQIWKMISSITYVYNYRKHNLSSF